ncbi:hypothetical protein MMC17_002054 [Xylographa soralifera]|nr:hypothetical protein [Xylographa soralifera]
MSTASVQQNAERQQDTYELNVVSSPQRPPSAPTEPATTSPEAHPDRASRSSEEDRVPPSSKTKTKAASGISNVPAWKKRSFRQRWFGGLKLVLRAWVSLSAAILVTNVSLFIWALISFKDNAGYGTIQRGDCGTSKTLNTWLHFAINVLSTGLLLGSAAFMVAAIAPTREEIRDAHRQRKWLTIGLLSFRNMSGVSTRKVLLCLTLAISSVPVHLFYNSVVFVSLSGNDYYWAVVTTDFLSGEPFNLTNSNYDSFLDFAVVGPSFDSQTSQQWTQWYTQIQQNVSSYERLDNENCIDAYSSKLVANRRNVVLVSSDKNSSNSVLAFDRSEISSEGDSDPTNWLCSQDPTAEALTCDSSAILQNATKWEVFEHPIEYCLSEQTTGSCAVKFSFSLGIVVIVCNFIKLSIELYLLFFGNLDKAITCVGDAIVSFIEEEDEEMHNISLVSTKRVDGILRYQAGHEPSLQYTQARLRWGSAAGRGRWIGSITLLIICLIFVSAVLAIGIWFVHSKGFNASAQGLWDLGFGAVDPEILIASENFGNPTTLSLLANIPQLVLAVLYFLYNSILTAMFTAQDVSQFAFKPQYLQVARPAGKQRGTWLLGMPIAWGIPMLVIQILLHWFVSQALFVVDVSVYNEDGTLNTDLGSITNCGFSPLAMICTLVMASLLTLVTCGLGLRKFKDLSPPLMADCSAAISAACHHTGYREKTQYMELKWGCTGYVGHDTGLVGHCAFIEARADTGAIVELEELQNHGWYR